MDANTFGVLVIAVAVGALFVVLATIRRPTLRVWTLMATVVFVFILIATIGLFPYSIWGIPD